MNFPQSVKPLSIPLKGFLKSFICDSTFFCKGKFLSGCNTFKHYILTGRPKENRQSTCAGYNLMGVM